MDAILSGGLYDEWGNYVGPELPDEGAGAWGASADVDGGAGGESDGAGSDVGSDAEADVAAARAVARAGPGGADGVSTAVVLHEDKKLYPDASDVYGAVETLVEEEDTQPLSTPLVAPPEARAVSFAIEEGGEPELTYSHDFAAGLLTTPSRVRNVALIGALHHGKTTLADALIEATRVVPWAEPPRYTDTLRSEACVPFAP